MRSGILALVGLSSLLFVGCDSHPMSHPTGVTTKPRAKPEDRAVNDGEGGNVDDRERAESFFQALEKVATADEEKAVVLDFAKWLNAHGFRIEVEQRDGEQRLACPHFPPVTPWTSHRFFDEKNLDLLPVSTARLVDMRGVRRWLPKAETSFLSDAVSAEVETTAPVTLDPPYRVIIDGLDLALEPDELILKLPRGTKRWKSPGVRQRILAAAGIQ